jgi:hypothetical protein
MLAAGIDPAVVERICWAHPVQFFAQSGRLDMSVGGERPEVDQRQLWEGNSVLRGQAPVVED